MTKKIYECELLQVSDEQGFIYGSDIYNNNMNYDTQNVVYHNITWKSSFSKKILVQKTKNPFYVEEIKTKRIIPLLYASYDTECKEGKLEYDFEKVHTFTRLLTRENPHWGKVFIGFFPIKDFLKIEMYLSQNKKFDEELENFFNNGDEKMKKRLCDENDMKKQLILTKERVG